MSKKIFLSASIFILLLKFNVYAGGIQFFQGTLAAAQAEAKKQNKLLCVDAYAEWCGPCKWMAANVFTDTAVGNYYNEHFVCYQLDQEKGDGPGFAIKYQVVAYPTFIFLNGDAELVHKVVGSAEAKDFLLWGNTAVNPSQNYAGLKKQYLSGERSRDFLYDFAKASLMAYDMDFPKYSNEFFKAIPPELMISEYTWDAVRMFMPDVNSVMFDYLTKNKNKYMQIAGIDPVNQYIDEAALQNLQIAVHSNDTVALYKAKKIVLTYGTFDAQKLMAMSEMKFYKKNNYYSRLISLARVYVDKYFLSDQLALNEIAEDFLQVATSQDDLALAEKWAKRSCDLEDSYYNNDTYAHILFKRNKKDEALIAANHAIDIGNQDGDDVSSTQDLVKQIKGE